MFGEDKGESGKREDLGLGRRKESFFHEQEGAVREGSEGRTRSRGMVCGNRTEKVGRAKKEKIRKNRRIKL